MNKIDLVDAIASAIDIPKKIALRDLDAVFDSIKQSLVLGNDVFISGFGSFKIKKREKRIGRNPKTGEKISIDASNAISFKVGKSLKEAINNKTVK